MAITEEDKKKILEMGEKPEEEPKVEPESEPEGEPEVEPKKEEPSQPDYDAELLKEQERKKKEREDRKKFFQKKEDDEDEEDKPITETRLRAILEEDRRVIQKETLAIHIEEKARKLASSESEAKLLIELHKNRSFPTYLSLDEQLEECYAIANRQVLLAKNQELKRALASKQTVKTDATGTYRESQAPDEPKMSAIDIQAIKRSGFEWDPQKRMYKKPVGKKHLFFDPKSKKRFVA